MRASSDVSSGQGVDQRQPLQACAREVSRVELPLRVGVRTIGRFKRRLIRVALPLERRGCFPTLPPLPRNADGYLITGLRADLQAPLAGRHHDLALFMRQRYDRHYAALQDGFDQYLAQFSGKTRSTLKRKLRKLEERSGGRLDLRAYSRPDQIDDFYRYARAVSATTYQERRLEAGLPEGQEALASMKDLASRDAMRSWILFLDGRPISYLFAPAEGDVLIYAYLGYDPAYAELSPGTVLQLEAMRALMAERRFRLFDFTEGDGQHKRQFATGSIDCVDLLLLRPTFANLAIGRSLAAFDGTVHAAKQVVTAAGFEKLARAVRR